jgi:hypothetical protein
MVYQTLSLTRDQFASFLSDFEQIKQFERLFANTNANVISIDDVSLAAGNSGASANDALAQIIGIAETLNKEPAPANVSQLAVIETQLAALDVAPPASNGSVTSVAASGGTTGLTFSGSPITTSGTLTLGGTLAVVNGGTGQTSYTDGQLLIGNTTGNTLTKATLTPGSGVSISNGGGSITISATGSGGTVTSVSVVSANGFAGTVATATTTPAITLTTTITGVLKGNGTAISAATADVDYIAPSAPVTKTANFTVAVGETWIINNKSGSTCTVTLPSAASYPGRYLTFQNNQDQSLVSASSNVIPQGGGAAGTAILTNVSGNWATLVSNGTNWVIMQAASFNNLLF